MKGIKFVIFISFLSLFSCGNNSPKVENQTDQKEVVNEVKPKVKFALFNEINKVRGILSLNGIGQLHDWKSDQMGGFMSITDYHLITNTTSNVAYYLESDNESYIKDLKLVLNINKKADKKLAISQFKETMDATFNSLVIEVPSGLLDAINQSKNYEKVTDNYTVTLDVYKDKIDVYTLKIETGL